MLLQNESGENYTFYDDESAIMGSIGSLNLHYDISRQLTNQLTWRI